MVREEDRRDEDLLGGQEYTVEVAATATLCNLIADFSPLKAVRQLWYALSTVLMTQFRPYSETVESSSSVL